MALVGLPLCSLWLLVRQMRRHWHPSSYPTAYNRPVIALELARELKVARLPWRPRRGDLAMDRLNIVYVVTRDGTDEDGAVEYDTGRGVERRPFLGLTWIPRLDQLVAYLARHGPFDLAARPAGQGRKDTIWSVTLSSPQDGTPRSFRASDAADAAGQAMHYLLSESDWHPGPAL